MITLIMLRHIPVNFIWKEVMIVTVVLLTSSVLNVYNQYFYWYMPSKNPGQKVSVDLVTTINGMIDLKHRSS